MTTPNPALIAATCNCLTIRHAARSIARRYDEALRTIDLNNGQFSMLVAISGLQPAGIQAIGERLGMDRTTVTAALKPLVRRDLVDVDVSEGDQRSRAVRLTQAGERLLELAVPLWQEAQREVTHRLGGARAADEFRRLLDRLG